ncbi:UNVERIFIED_CONTAM: hypothetical protein Slati_4439200 [Sesamum latifolium]|uniref:Uncharacterized protein n=1 Tax=Sesamum latifolium TaxID=2727402 RepID=A0AAW2SQ70_9LAMI
MDASRIKANKASCISCIVAFWGGTHGGAGFTWGGGVTSSLGGRTSPLSGAYSWMEVELVHGVVGLLH